MKNLSPVVKPVAETPLPATGRRETNKRDKLDRIRRATRDVILAKGFENATIHEIAHAAGVAHGTIFLYASDKQDLLLLIFEEHLAKLRQKAMRLSECETGLVDQLTAFFRPIYKFFLSTPQLSRDMLREVAFSDGIVAKRIGKDIAGFEASLASLITRAQVAGAIRQDVAADSIAKLLFSLHRMQMRLCIAERAPNQARSLGTLRSQFKLVLEGLLPR
jgi:AcrR family transcriptional regulator